MPDYIDIVITETPTYIDVAAQESVFIDIDLGGGSGGGAVDSVNGKTGVVVLDATDVGADPAGSAAAALSAANDYTDDNLLPIIPVVTGLWRGTLCTQGFSTGSGWLNYVWYVPYFTGKAQSVSGIRVHITTGSALTKVSLALYSHSSYAPLTLLEESGDLDSSSSGILTYTFSSPINLTDSLYWMAFQASSNSIAIRTSQVGIVTGFPRASAAPFTTCLKGQAYGAFPSLGTPNVYQSSSASTPVIELLVG